jgi:spore coat protein U-like protein
MQKIMRGFWALVLVVAATKTGEAGQATTQFQVSATVLNNCAVSASNLSFGNYSPGSGSPTDMNTNLSVTCTNGLTYTIALDGGGSHSVAARVMTDTNSDTLSYGLYTSNAYTTIWGDGTGGSSTVPGTGNGSAQSIPVYGQIAAAQYVPAGSYQDTISVSVNY